jgi:hypothetical protein
MALISHEIHMCSEWRTIPNIINGLETLNSGASQLRVYDGSGLGPRQL